MTELISQAEYARRRGLSKRLVNKQVAQGVIPLVNGKIDPALADRGRAENLHPAHGGKRREPVAPVVSYTPELHAALSLLVAEGPGFLAARLEWAGLTPDAIAKAVAHYSAMIASIAIGLQPWDIGDNPFANGTLPKPGAPRITGADCALEVTRAEDYEDAALEELMERETLAADRLSQSS